MGRRLSGRYGPRRRELQDPRDEHTRVTSDDNQELEEEPVGAGGEWAGRGGSGGSGGEDDGTVPEGARTVR